jgi:Predicted flavin-nucleotide-binding protein structurally related to pyridoxine 5''-phosphate oxidase
MTANYLQTMLGQNARRYQEMDGSRGTYANLEARADDQPDLLGPNEIDFILARDSFYMASVTEDGWPYVQHKGGPKGFLTPLSGKYIGYSDFRGNRQFMTAGNVTGNNRVSLILVDYPARRRLKIAGLASYLTAAEAPELVHQITPQSVERLAQAAVIIEIVAFDWNCPAHITPRWTELELQKMNELTV